MESCFWNTVLSQLSKPLPKGQRAGTSSSPWRRLYRVFGVCSLGLFREIPGMASFGVSCF